MIRWFDETMLDCCDPIEVIQVKGITLPKLDCLARCNGALVFHTFILLFYFISSNQFIIPLSK